jgi:hypothetical protein
MKFQESDIIVQYRLDMAQVSWLHIEEVTVGREGQVAKSNEGKDPVSENLYSPNVTLGNTECRGRDKFCPSEITMSKEHESREDVVHAPNRILE